MRGGRLPSASVRRIMSSGSPKVFDRSSMPRPFFHQLGKGFPARHVAGIKPGDILDQRGFECCGIVARLDDRTWHRLTIAGAAGTPFVGDGKCCMEAPPPGDDLERLRAAAVCRTGADEDRNEHAARAHRGKDIGNIGGFPAAPHIGGRDGKLAKIDMREDYRRHSM